jgi:hypothetical protein
MLRLASGTDGGGVTSSGIGLGGKSGASSRREAGLSVGVVPSLVPGDEVERGAPVPLLAFPVPVCVGRLGVEPKKAYQSVKSAPTPRAMAAIIFLRSDLGFSSGVAIACSLKIS